MPKLVYSPRTAFAIPIISLFLCYLISSLLLSLHLFNTSAVTSIAFSLGAIAVYRMRNLMLEKPLSWPRLDCAIYLLHAVLLFPFFIKLGTHGFDRGDEIYSWNFWAIQHFYNEAIDFSHTGAPYPQLFPKWLATCYRLLGNLDLQLPVKATLIVFPWAMLTAVAMTFRQQFAKHAFIYIGVLLYVLWATGLAQFFDDGYADPVMTSALVVSGVLFWQSQHRLSIASPYLAFLSVICGFVCAHSKQPGLLWAAFSLPILLLLAYSQEKDKRYVMLAGMSCLGALLWVVGEGQQFHQNQGVLWLSFGERNFAQQLLHSINQYFIKKPALLGLFALTIWVSREDTILKRMVWLFLIPGWICWFLFGAYQLRLGQHLMAFAFLIVIASHYPFPTLLTLNHKWQRLKQICIEKQKPLILGLASFSFMIGSVLFVKEIYIVKGGASVYAGGRQSLQRYFGTDADYVYQNIYSDQEAVLWVPTRYLYGLFYKRTKLTTPDYLVYDSYQASALINELQRKMPDYVFTVNAAVIDGPASQVLSEVVEACPKAFQRISGPKNRFNFITYKIDKLQLQKDPCLVSLMNADRFQLSSRLSLAPQNEGKVNGTH